MPRVSQNVNLGLEEINQETFFWSNFSHPTIFASDFTQYEGKAPTEKFLRLALVYLHCGPQITERAANIGHHCFPVV